MTDSTTTDHETDTAIAAALECIDAYDYVTPWQALRATGIDSAALMGNEMLGIDGTNVYFAVGLSDLAVGLLTRICRLRLLEGTVILVLLVEGDHIPVGMPFAKRPPKGGYRHEHFAPAIFRKAGIH